MKKNNKSIIILVCMIFLIILFLTILVVLNYQGVIPNEPLKNIHEIGENDNQRQKLNDQLSYEVFSDEGIYCIYDEEGNQVGAVYNESELEFYKENPDFNPTFGVYQKAQEDGIDENLEESQE